MTHYDEELQALQQKLSRKKHLQSLLNELHTQRVELEAKVSNLRAIIRYQLQKNNDFDK